MRSETEMMKLLVDFAEQDPRIRLATLEGSRTNVNIKPDVFQDYDISYFVTDLDAFKLDDGWLDAFGERAMLQKPEAMELFRPELGNWFSYLILFEDGNKLDLTLIPIDEAASYFADSDGLVRVLTDKDGLSPENLAAANDEAYWIRKPTARSFDDCCNEFWMVSTYVAKGLARGELLFAIDHLNEIARPNLLRMMAWEIGADRGYGFSVGKHYKFIDRYLPEEHWAALLSTYRLDNAANVWNSLYGCFELFRRYAKSISDRYGYPFPDYDRAVTSYVDQVRAGAFGRS